LDAALAIETSYTTLVCEVCYNITDDEKLFFGEFDEGWVEID